MITKTRRFMSEEEQKLVERLQRDGREAVGCRVVILVLSTLLAAWIGALVGLFVAWFLVGGQYGYRMNGHSDPELLLRFAGTGAVLATGLMLWAFYVSWPQRRNLSLVADRLGTEVELVHVHAFGVARIRDSFFFDVGEEKCLVLHGAYLRTAFESGRFPNRYFAIVKAPHSRLSLGVECHGEPLTASLPNGPDVDPTRIPDGAVVPVRLATLKEDLLVLLGSGWVPA